jgi:flavin reductase (DIM6/NTAB) family NADH-FMN oxidoreductase RutF
MDGLKQVRIGEVADEILEQIPKGAFLTVKAQDKLNTMTIGWGTFGRMWNKPVFMVMVRYSRYTYELIEKADTFTVSVPLNGKFKEALAFCGSKSGRDRDKFKECNLTAKPGQKVDTPVIEGCDIHVECRILYKQPLDPEKLPKEIIDMSYKDGDFHVLYYGEILGVYIEEQ